MPTINNRNIQNIRDAFGYYYENPDFIDGPKSFGDFYWTNKASFNEFVFDITQIVIKNDKDQANIKAAQQGFEKEALKIKKETERTTPEDIKNLEENAARVETERQKTITDAKENVNKMLEAQQKAKDLKNLYAKVEITPKKTDAEVEQAINELKTKYQGVEHQREMAGDVAKFIEERVTPVLSKDLPKEEIMALSQKAAANWVQAINNPDVVAAYEAAAVQDAILVATANDAKVSDITRQAAADLFEARRSGIEIDRQFIEGTFGKSSGNYFGTRIPDIKVDIYQDASGGFTHTLDAEKLNSGYGEFLERQFEFLDSYGSYSGDPRSFLLGQLGKAVDVRMAALPADSLIRGLYTNSTVRNVFSFATGGPVSITLDSSTWIGGAALRVPGGIKTVNIVGGAFGINFKTAGTAATTGIAAIGEVGKGAAIKAGSAAVKGAQVAAGAGTTGGIVAAATAFFAWTGPLAPVLGTATGLLANLIGGELLKNIVSRVSIFIGKHKEDFIALIAAVFGFRLFGGVAGAVGAGLFAYFGARALFRGLGGPGNVLKAFGSQLGRLIGRGLFQSIIKLLIIILIAIPIIVAFVLFIINSGAYIVPPSISSLSPQNEFIDVTKTASPEGPFENSDLPLKITYTVTISAKKGGLTNVSAKDVCSAITKSGSQDCDAPNIEVPGKAISVGSPFTFTYDADYKTFKDALVVDTVKVTASTLANGKQETSGSSSIIIGTPPTGCFKLDGTWKDPNKITAANKAIARLTQATTYAARLCQRGTITVKYGGPSNWGGWAPNVDTIVLYDLGVNLGDTATLYTLAHESGHIFAYRTDQYSGDYINKADLAAERPICSYPTSPHPASEDFAEMVGLYVAKDADTRNGAACGMFGNGFKQKYPIHWNYANKNLFGGQMLGW